jgi:hypothetical protein
VSFGKEMVRVVGREVKKEGELVWHTKGENLLKPDTSIL